jgi:hypothetical protein
MLTKLERIAERFHLSLKKIINKNLPSVILNEEDIFYIFFDEVENRNDINRRDYGELFIASVDANNPLYRKVLNSIGKIKVDYSKIYTYISVEEGPLDVQNNFNYLNEELHRNEKNILLKINKSINDCIKSNININFIQSHVDFELKNEKNKIKNFIENNKDIFFSTDSFNEFDKSMMIEILEAGNLLVTCIFYKNITLQNIF